MQRVEVALESGFQVLAGNGKAQAAEMTLGPGESTGGPDNRHADSDQWLFVVSGAGEAVVDGERVELPTHALVLIEAGEAHEIRCTGSEPLRTLNLYVPPEY